MKNESCLCIFLKWLFLLRSIYPTFLLLWSFVMAFQIMDTIIYWNYLHRDFKRETTICHHLTAHMAGTVMNTYIVIFVIFSQACLHMVCMLQSSEQDEYALVSIKKKQKNLEVGSIKHVTVTTQKPLFNTDIKLRCIAMNLHEIMVTVMKGIR